MNSRVDQHKDGKDFWTHVVIAAHDDLTKSHAVTAEAELIGSAKAANRYKVTNGNDGQPESLGDQDIEIVRSFVAGLSGLLDLAHYDFLKPTGTGLFEYQRKMGGGRGVLQFKLRLADAAAKEVWILPDSQLWAPKKIIPEEVVEAQLEAAGELRDDLCFFQGRST